MITGIHALIYSRQADDVRAFLRDVLGWRAVDAGEGWLIFALPPAELAVHPAEEGSQELYLMCDDLQRTVAELERNGVALARPIREEAWGRVTALELPGGSVLGLYEPRHPTALALGPDEGSTA
jgi:predicted enzyme related to lactoylglutathione lyase